MRKVWVLVANSSLAKIYRANESQKLVERETFEHFESHLHNRDLVSDSNGQPNLPLSGSTLPHTYEKKTTPKVKESIHFADQIADYLEEGFHKGEFERLYVIANPTFLGHLRQAIPTILAKKVYTEIPKDLTQFTPEHVRQYLPLML